MLWRMAYLSRAVLPPDEVIDGILEISVHNNARDGITGLLLSDGERFLQAIEGEDARVRRCMDRIAADDRHTGLDIIGNEAVDARQFGDWSLAYKRTPPATCTRAFLEDTKRHVASVTDPALAAMFIGFARLAR